MICQDCGVEAPTRYVSFSQNIGALFMRFPKTVAGDLCKSCIHKHFWEMTGITAVLGWWGMISFIVTPFMLLNNIGRYLFCVSMSPVPPGSIQPTLSQEEVDRIRPHANRIFERLNQGEDFRAVAVSTAEVASVSPGQVLLFVQTIVNSHSEE